MRPTSLLIAGLSLSLAGLAPGTAAEWQVDGEAENQVEFTSEVVGFSFSGTNDDIDGYLYWEGEGLFERNSQLYFEVDLRTLDTGIGKRDRDMRDVLNTGKWPRATYKATVVSHRADTSGQGYRVETKGTFSLHGVEREMAIPGRLAFDGQRATADAEFTVRLGDFDIEAPSLAAFVKVSEEVSVRVRFGLKLAKGE
jgi:polyisoprenoid-binding protein YceI